MQLFFELIDIKTEKDKLASFLINEKWPFHVNSQLKAEKVNSMIKEGIFSGSNHQCFWILSELSEIVGFIRLFDLDDIDDGYPLFDLRVRENYRGKKVGKIATKWLTDYLFKEYPVCERIVGTTRVDNIPMRKTFSSCGYVKEGHYRKDWWSSDGKRYDTVAYAIIREDWESGKSTPVNWND